jgi:hypothetical protein
VVGYAALTHPTKPNKNARREPGIFVAVLRIS